MHLIGKMDVRRRYPLAFQALGIFPPFVAQRIMGAGQHKGWRHA